MARPRTVQGKITRVVVATSGVSLLLATVALMVDEYRSHREDTAGRVRTIGRIVASQSATAVLFRNAREAEQILSALRAESDLAVAAIYTTDGSLFVRYLRPNVDPREAPSRAPPGASGFHSGSFALIEPVVAHGEKAGTLYLRSDLGQLRARMVWNAAIGLTVLATASVIAFLLATRLVPLVTRPIFRLEQMALRVTGERDYAVRAVQESDDEVGRLVHAFNEMLGQIQLRDDALRKAQADLEERVQARTVALQNALRELESFTYTISHDLRAPLRAMTGFSRALVEDYGDVLDETGREFARRIAAAARKMDALILDLLDYSRLTRQDLRIERVDVDRLVTEVLRQMEAEIRERGADIQIEPPLPSVMGHSLTLRQALTNLVSNAVKFVAAGVTPRVRIRGHRRNGAVRLEVEDNGIGIAPQYLDRIFRIFERLNPSDEFPGTGIGLAIVRRAMERMGGSSGVESEVGRGSRFWVELPGPPEEGSGPTSSGPR